MAKLALAVMVALLLGAALVAPVHADPVSEASRQLEDAEAALAKLRSEYAVLAEHAHGAEDALAASQLLVISLQRSMDDTVATVSEARRNVAARARRAYMGDPLGNLGAALRLYEYGLIDSYLPYVARPLEQDRRTVEVYKQRLAALRGLEEELLSVRGEASRQVQTLADVESRLIANLNRQQEEIARLRADLRAEEERAAEAAEAAAATARAAAEQAPSGGWPLPGPAPGGVVLVGPQVGSGPGPEAGIPDPIDVPPAPRDLPNGVLLGPTAGIPPGMVSGGVKMSGVASWYGPGFHGWQTANGETYDQYGFTAAHKDLPFNTVLIVSHGDRSILVRINDRGPYIDGRFLDLSKAGAEALGISGIGYVDAEIVVAG